MRVKRQIWSVPLQPKNQMWQYSALLLNRYLCTGAHGAGLGRPSQIYSLLPPKICKSPTEGERCGAMLRNSPAKRPKKMLVSYPPSTERLFIFCTYIFKLGNSGITFYCSLNEGRWIFKCSENRKSSKGNQNRFPHSAVFYHPDCRSLISVHTRTNSIKSFTNCSSPMALNLEEKLLRPKKEC